MEFVSASFPGVRIYLQLYELRGRNENLSSDELNSRKQGLASLAATYTENFSIVNATNVVSIMHLHIAVSRALLGKRDQKMKTQTLGHEILYFMHPQHSIQQSLLRYGIKGCSDALFAVYVDFPP